MTPIITNPTSTGGWWHPDRRLVLFLAGVAIACLAWDVGPTSDDYFHFVGVHGKLPDSWLFDGTVPPESWGFFRPLGLWELFLYARSGFRPELLRLGHIVLHGLATLLTGVLAGRLGARPRRQLLAGLLFSCHPAISQAIGLLSCRFDLWAAVLSLASVWWLDRSLVERTPGALAASASCFLLALGFKECAAVLPLILLCWCLWRPDEDSPPHGYRWAAALPHCLIGLIYMLLRAQLLGWKGPYGSPSMVPSLAQVNDGWWAALGAFTRWHGAGKIDQLLMVPISMLATCRLISRASRRGPAICLTAGLLWLLPACVLLARCAEPIAGRLMYGAWPWFAMSLALAVPAAPRAISARPLFFALGLVAYVTTMSVEIDARLECCRRASERVTALAEHIVLLATNCTEPVSIVTEKTPGTMDGTFLFPGGLGLVTCSVALALNRPAPEVYEQGWPLDAARLAARRQLTFVTLNQRDGHEERPTRIPSDFAAFDKDSIPLHLVPNKTTPIANAGDSTGRWYNNEEGGLESQDLEVTCTAPAVLTFEARALLDPAPARCSPLSWGRVLTRRTRSREFSPQERSLFLLVADGRWRTYRIVLDPTPPFVKFPYDHFMHPGIAPEELKELRGIRICPLTSPGRVWLRQARLMVAPIKDQGRKI